MSYTDEQLATDLTSLCNSPEFLQLKQDWEEFSPFRVLKVERYELRHTTTLAWLLDPRASHKIGSAFLRCFLQQIARYAPFDVREVNADTAEVLAELQLNVADPENRDRLDVLVEGRHPSGRPWGIAIEAKIDSAQGKDQLDDYSKALQTQFEERDLLKLYLTVAPDPADSDDWQNVLWGDVVAPALEQALQEHPPANQKVRDFLDHYLALLNSLRDDRSDGLAHRIAGFTNRATVTPLLRALRERRAMKPVVRSWDSEAWVLPYWQSMSLLDECIQVMRDPGSVHVWETVLQHFVGNDSHIITQRQMRSRAVKFVPQSWLAVPELQGANNKWKLCYHAEFRDEPYCDIEIKLYVPPSREREAQKALVRRLLEKDRDAFSFHEPALNDFLGEGGKSVKLHKFWIKWTRQEDGSFRCDAQQLADMREVFAEARARHTTAVLKLAQSA